MTIPLETLKQAIARYERGDRIMDLALDFKVSFYAMRNALREAGVQIRSGNATRSIQRKQQQTEDPEQPPQEPRVRPLDGYNELMGRMARVALR